LSAFSLKIEDSELRALYEPAVYFKRIDFEDGRWMEVA
jgi:hypothetical protein